MPSVVRRRSSAAETWPEQRYRGVKLERHFKVGQQDHRMLEPLGAISFARLGGDNPEVVRSGPACPCGVKGR